MYIPDPTEIIEMRAERLEDSISVEGDVWQFACMECGKTAKLSDAESLDQFGTFIVCPECFENYVESKR